jgi:phospholipid/cholesterol/gamma-HCH transport system substrate-binding protein
VEALGGKDKQLAELVDSSNAVFKTFAAEDANVQRTLRLLPGALHKTGVGLAKLATATGVLGPTLHKLLPFASSLAPAQEATRRLANETTPVIKNEIRPFARQILPVVNQLGPSTQQLGEAFPKLQVSFAVLTEFFNELAYNPQPNKGNFLFFLAWANHNLNSVVSSADAHGPVGRSLIYFNCEVLKILKGVQEVNPTVNLLINLLRPPTKAECVSQGVLTASAATASAARARTSSRPKSTAAGGPFSSLAQRPFSAAASSGVGGGG